MTWITTRTTAGPLTRNDYYYTITGLSASTKYIYRAYFIIDGIEYYGNILSGTTASLSITIPATTTGNLNNAPLTTSFSISGNTITNNGNAPIIEYGLLYTQKSIYGTNDTLVFSNYPTNVCKASSISDIPSVPYVYTTGTTGLTPNTITYYRAFAKNAKGIGYGIICTQQTAVPPASNINFDVTISWNNLYFHSATDGIGGTFWLKCCNDTIVQTCNISNYTKYIDTLWSVPAGCYYVDFNGLEARKNGLLIPWEINWNDGVSTGNYSNTLCYNSNRTITASIPLLDSETPY